LPEFFNSANFANIGGKIKQVQVRGDRGPKNGLRLGLGHRGDFNGIN